MSRILVTGANGFIGQAFCSHALNKGHFVREVVRKLGSNIEKSINNTVEIGNISHQTDWSCTLDEIEVVVHLAARVHVMKETSSNPLNEYRKINVDGTRRLAESAIEAGVRRFVYVSSVGVNGNQTKESPFTETTPPAPTDYYTLSKLEAEQVLHQFAKETNLEIVIVRPSLTYGPHVKGNMLRLLRLINSSLPLPLANISNRRSFIGVDNLATLLLQCVKDPRAAGETFLAADGEDLSTPDLITRIAKALHRTTRLFPLPRVLLMTGASILNKKDTLNRLCGTLIVDTSKLKKVLGWTPNVSVTTGLEKMAYWYLGEHVNNA